MEKSTETPQMNAAVGRLTYIDAYQQEQMALHGQRQLRSQLALIRAALERVKAKTYGICTSCGVAIPPVRLEYMLEASCCVNCNDIDRHMLYVGCTRAMHTLDLTHTAEPSPFVASALEQLALTRHPAK